MALFGRKKTDDEPQPDKAEGAAPGGGYSPEKAVRFFDHARTSHDTANFEYAMQLWLSGLQQDPHSLQGVEGFFRSAASFLGEKGPKASVNKAVIKAITGKGALDRYVLALLEWGLRPSDPVLAVRAADVASQLNLTEPTKWIGERAFGAVLQDRRPRKELFLKLKEAFGKVGFWERAVQSAEQALKLDPTDGPLQAEIRNLAAQATMTKGGFQNTGQVGGFRANIKDAEKQRQLEQQDKIVKTEETVERLIAEAEAEYQRRPMDIPTIQVYAKRLRERGTSQDLQRAIEILEKAYAETNQFTFREQLGQVKLRIVARRLSELKAAAAAKPGDAAAKAAFDKAQREYLEQELEEHKILVEAYPTDLTKKFELGRRYQALGDYENGLAMFQESQSDPKYRAMSMFYIAQAFSKMGWMDESIGAYRATLDLRDLPADLQIEARYGLMVAMGTKAQESRDISLAEEADKIASAIAIQQITYRDIRARREWLKKLVTELKSGGSAAASGGGGGGGGGGGSGGG